MNNLLKSLLSTVCVLFSCVTLAEVTQLDVAALEELRAKGVAIIDVRRIDEWESTGVIEGSHPITFFDKQGRYDVAAWIEQLDAVVKPDQPVILICQHGVRSSKIADLLDKRLGYSSVHNVTQGISAWIEAQRPVSSFQP